MSLSVNSDCTFEKNAQTSYVLYNRLAVLIFLPMYTKELLFLHTRSYAADLDWTVGPAYSLGGYILGYSQRLASCLWHSARITLLYFDILLYFFPTTLYFSPTLLQFLLTFCSQFHTFDTLFQYFLRTFCIFFCTFSSLFLSFFPFFPYSLQN